jgi:hypothetical protein
MATLRAAELQSLINGFATVLEHHHGNHVAVRDLRDLCGMFVGNESKAAAAFLKVAQTQLGTALRDFPDCPRVGNTIPSLTSLRNLIKDIAKSDLNACFDTLLEILRKSEDTAISAFVEGIVSASVPKPKATTKAKPKPKKSESPVDSGLVDQYVKRLEAALGDDGKFEPLIGELNSDDRVTQSLAVAIASQFSGPTTKSTSRPKAIGRVRERHAKLMKFKRETSTAGRSAA